MGKLSKSQQRKTKFKRHNCNTVLPEACARVTRLKWNTSKKTRKSSNSSIIDNNSVIMFLKACRTTQLEEYDKSYNFQRSSDSNRFWTYPKIYSPTDSNSGQHCYRITRIPSIHLISSFCTVSYLHVHGDLQTGSHIFYLLLNFKSVIRDVEQNILGSRVRIVVRYLLQSLH